MGIAFWLAVLVVVQGTLLLIRPHADGDEPMPLASDHRDRPWLRVLALALLVIDLALLTLAELGSLGIGPGQGEGQEMSGLVCAGAAIALMLIAYGCWGLSWRRPRTRESTVWQVLMLGTGLVIVGVYGLMAVSH